jgi:transcriptional regulator with XRE-family HTH domain
MEEIDFSLLKTAGIKQSEFAELVGVSRAAVNAWCTGIGKIHPLRVARVAKFMVAIRLAVDDKALPLPSDVLSINRLAKIRETLLTQLKKG